MTVKELRQKLEILSDNVEVKIGYGEQRNPIRFIIAESNCIILHSNVYMADPTEELVKTIAIHGKFDKEDKI